MALIPWQATVQDDSGNAIPLPVVTVRNDSDASLATLYDIDGNELVGGNPITGDADGFVQFQVIPGRYTIDGAKDASSTATWHLDAGAEYVNFASQEDLDALDTRLDVVEAAQTSGVIYRDPVAAWAGSNITLSGSQTVDGVTMSNGDRVGVGGQTAPEENGVYAYNDSGAWTRAADMDTSGEISLSTVFVSGGTTYGGYSYRFSVADEGTFTLDTDAITATQVGDAGALQDQIALKADAADAALTGTPTAPTATTGTDTTQIATTAFVHQELDGYASAENAVTFNIAYANTGGQGNRTTSISVIASAGILAAGDASNLVDGATATNPTDSIAFNAVSVAGEYLLFDFLFGAEKIIREVTWEQSGSQTHGTWKWQGSNDASTWSDIGSSFALGGATSQTHDLSSNDTGYRYYRLLGVSGTASASPYIQEVEFEIGDALTAGYVRRTEISRFPSTFPTGKLIAAYFFDEASETEVNDAWAEYDIDLTAPTDPNATPTALGVKLAAGLIETPELPSCRSQTVFYRTDYGGASNGFIVSGGSSSGSGTLQRDLITTETHYIAGFGIGWFVPQMGSGGGAAYAMCSGQWAVYHREDAGVHDSIYGIGGRHSTTTSRCDEFEAGAAFFWNDTLTDAERDAVLLFVRQRAAARGVYIHRADPPEQADLYMITGESNADGRALIADLSASDQGADYRHTLIVAQEAGTLPVPVDKFEIGYNQKYDGGFAAATYVGPEIGVATQRRADYLSDLKRAIIYKNAKGSTQVAPTSTGVSGALTWNASEAADSSGLFWAFIRQMQVTLGDYCARGIGFGDTVRVGLWIGLNDATDTAYTTDAATYQSYLQDWLDTLEEYLPGMAVEVVIFRAHNSDPASDATALGHVRTASDDFGTANGNVTVVDTDAYGLEADSVHYDAAANITMGVTLHG